MPTKLERMPIGAQLTPGKHDDLIAKMQAVPVQHRQGVIIEALRLYFKLPRQDQSVLHQFRDDIALILRKLEALETNGTAVGGSKQVKSEPGHIEDTDNNG